MLFDMQPTSFDVRFRLFGIPIRIHPSYWLITVLLVASLAQISLILGLMAIAALLLSLLCHEMAHALVFRRYRIYSHVVLYSFGGVAIPDHSPPRYTQRIAVALAAPLTNLFISALVWGSDQIDRWSESSAYAMAAYWLLFNINLFLGIINLLPIWPLDGGQVSLELWMRARPRDGAIYALRMSLTVCLLFIAYTFITYFNLIPGVAEAFFGLRPGIFAAVIFIMIAMTNYQHLQSLTTRRSPWDRY